MKFYCNGMDLSSATNIVSKAIAVNKNIPALEGIKIKAYENKVLLSAYNQEMYIEKTINAEVLVEGEVVVNGKMFNDYSNKLSSFEKLDIEKSMDGKIIINYEGSEAEINYFELSNFPEFGEYEDKECFSIKESECKELLERAVFCVAVNDNRMLLKSCKIETLDNKIVEAVCMDGYRIAISQKNFSEGTGKIKCNVLGKIISDLTKILGDNDDLIKVCLSKKMLIIDLGHTKIRTTTVDGDFYKYENILPREINTEVIVNKEELENCLVRSSIIARETPTNGILVKVENNTINISVKNEKCKGSENIKCKKSGEDISFSINSKYLQDAVSRIKEDYLKIELKMSNSPLLIKKIDSEDYRCIILPIRTI